MREGVLLGLSLAAPIGPINIEILRRGVKDWKQGVLVSLGTLIAELTRLTLVFIGLYRFLESREANFILWSFGFVILAYLGIGGIKDSLRREKIKLAGKQKKGNSILIGFLLTISNPLGIVFWAGIYGSLLTSLSITNRLTGLITGFWIVVGIILWLIIYNVIIYLGKSFLIQNVFKCISLVSGVVLLLFAFKFGYQALSVISSQ